MNDQFGYQHTYLYEPTQYPSNGHAAGYATTALVLGIVSIVLCCCCCCLFFLAIVPGILAIIFSFLAKRDNGGKMPGKAVAGMILGILGILLFLLLCVVVFAEIFSMPEDPSAMLRELEQVYRDMGIDVDFSDIYDQLEGQTPLPEE